MTGASRIVELRAVPQPGAPFHLRAGTPTTATGPGHGARPTTPVASQQIYFATSDDLNTWRKTDTVFETDTSLYNVAAGAWDCIVTLPAGDGSLYGYFFANSKNPTPLPSGQGGGFAHSKDGVQWAALPSVASSASSVFRFGPRIWLTARNGVALAVRSTRFQSALSPFVCVSLKTRHDRRLRAQPASPAGRSP